MEEIKLNMENLTKEEREQLLKLVEKANKKESKVWKPELDEIYYCIRDTGSVMDNIWRAGDAWAGRYSLGNCFKTKEEAEFALERHKVIVELERFAKENNDPNLPTNVYLYCYKSPKGDKDGTSVNVVSADRYYSALGTIAFSDIPTAKKAIQTIGEDRLIKYYFGIKD